MGADDKIQNAAEDLGEFVLHHIVNSKVWHVTPWGPTLHLPTWLLGGVDVSPSLHVVMMFIAAVLLVVLLLPASRRSSFRGDLTIPIHILQTRRGRKGDQRLLSSFQKYRTFRGKNFNLSR